MKISWSPVFKAVASTSLAITAWTSPLNVETVPALYNHAPAQVQLLPSRANALGLPLFHTQYESAADIPLKDIQNHNVIYASVIKVIDGDTIRVRHIPNYPLGVSNSLEYSGKLSDKTISVRFYGVDCPETAKFGNPAMPYANEAMDYTKQRVKLTKSTKATKLDEESPAEIVRIKLLSRDQYGRVIGKVEANRNDLPLFLPRIMPRSDLSLDLTKRGYATVYTGAGAEYDGHKDLFMQTLQDAQQRRVGMWSNGLSNVQTPAEYKRAVKQQQLQQSQLVPAPAI